MLTPHFTQEWLLERGAEITCVQYIFPSGEVCDCTAFEYAAESGNVEFIKLLLSHEGSKCTVTAKTIFSGAQSRSGQMMRFLLGQGEYPVLPEDRTGADPWKGHDLDAEQKEAILEAIPQAAYSKSFPVLRLLTACFTPLPELRLLSHSMQYKIISLAMGITASRGSIESLDLLLDVGFSPTVPIDVKIAKELAKSRGWYTNEALVQASRFGLLHVVDHLLQRRDANVNFIRPPDEKATPLYRAAENGHAECVKKLVNDCHADVQIGCGRNRNGPTALWIATKNQQIEAVKVLLEYGGPFERIEPEIRTDTARFLITAREGHRYPVEIIDDLQSKGSTIST